MLLNEIVTIIAVCHVLLYCLALPVLVSFFHLLLLFFEKHYPKKLVLAVDGYIHVFGIFLSFLLWSSMNFSEWNVPLRTSWPGLGENSYYTPISFDHMPTFLTLLAVALVGYALPRFFGHKLSPVLAALSFGGVFLGMALSVVLLIQLGHCSSVLPIYAFFMLLYPINYLLSAFRLMRNSASDYAASFAERSYENKLLRWCQRVLCKASSFMFLSFLLSLPLLFFVILILTLFGQQPDSVIKAFTETAEWTLSQKIPPPRMDYDAHYLCTVAACGDEKVVKPLRAGRRRGELIVVNRQLLVANAFEDLLARRVPCLHRLIRNTYDRIGFPLSRYVNTPRRSNLVYFLMKPLEWFFVLVLYTWDKNPENRIHRQYLGE